MTTCESCHAPILWAAIPGGRMPIDREPVIFEAVGLVAYNAKTGGGRVLAGSDLGRIGRWKQLGATLHRSHFATCPNASKHRRPDDGQLSLGGAAA